MEVKPQFTFWKRGMMFKLLGDMWQAGLCCDVHIGPCTAWISDADVI